HFYRVVANDISINDMNMMGNDSFNVQTGQNTFAAADKFRILYDSVRVKYADGTEYRFMYQGARFVNDKNYIRLVQVNTFPIKVLDEYVHIYHLTDIRIDSMFYKGYLPRIDLKEGDSLFIYSDFKLDFNYHPSSNNDPDPPLVGFRTHITQYCQESGLAYNDKYVANKYTGYKLSWNGGAYSLKPCENSTQSKPFNLRLRIARENLFPREVRPLAFISNFWQTMPVSALPISVKLKYLALQDSVIRLNNLNLPFTQTPGLLNINFSPAFSMPIDEGFMLGTDVVFGPDCRFGKPDSSKQHLVLQFYNNPDSLVEKKFNSLGYFSNLPNLKLQSADTLLYVTQKNFDVDFKITNNVISPAQNLWVAAVSPSGKATDFKLVQLPQQQAVTSTGGVFQLNTLTGLNEKNYRLTGLNTSCETDTLLLIYGWDCSQVQSLSQNSCGRDTFFILLRKESPELEMDIKHEPIPLVLCDTSDYYEIAVYNAKTGYAYDLNFTAALPPGLRVVPGTCQISYPTGSPYITISDPAFIGQVYQWDINTVQAVIAANGLPGIGIDPQNGFNIRFKTIAECGFVANIQPVFGIKGVDPCGQETNFLNKPGSPININGLNPAYGVILNLDPAGAAQPYCGGEQEYKCSLTLLGQPSSNDSIFILLPNATTYITGSYVAGTNAPTTAPTLSGQQIAVHIPPGLSNGSSLSFTFKVRFELGSGCDSQFIKAQSRVSTPAFCQSLGAPCNIYLVTGEITRPITVLHPQLALNDANIQINGNQVNATFNINNIGTVPASGVTARVWYDVNGNGILEPGIDQLLTTVQQNQTLQPGQTLTLSANFTGTMLDFCNLIVVLPATENCLCEDQLLPLHNNVLYFAQQQFCTNAPITVGTPMEQGFNYNWLTTNGILCGTCATTTYTPPVSVQPGVPQTLTLEAQSGNCKLQYNYKVVFGNVYSVTPTNATICKGTSVTLNVQSTSGTYTWSGPGIVNPTLAQQTVTPEVSTVYHLSISLLPAPCLIDTTIAIEVIHGDTIQLDELFTCKGVPVQVLNQNTDVAGLYSKEQTNANGCKDLVQQRLTVYNSLMTEETKQFCLGDTLKLADTSFTNSGKICRSFQTINGCDSVHCVIVTTFEPPHLDNPDTLYGQVLTPIKLTGQSGFTSYIWYPAIPGCSNCQDATVKFDTAGFYEYILTVGDGNGCIDTVIYRILIFPPCSAKRVLVPNVFTPNGDDVNDTFKVVDREGAELIGSMTIYDRWGEKVYESKSQVFWDGTIDRQPAPSDVYVYIIEVLCDGNKAKLVGNVTLLR
ncbi:MAG: gliding motility-associated C-terminal domain-containing protein, partial [Bacteroidota bacterium]